MTAVSTASIVSAGDAVANLVPNIWHHQLRPRRTGAWSGGRRLDWRYGVPVARRPRQRARAHRRHRFHLGINGLGCLGQRVDQQRYAGPVLPNRRSDRCHNRLQLSSCSRRLAAMQPAQPPTVPVEITSLGYITSENIDAPATHHSAPARPSLHHGFADPEH